MAHKILIIDDDEIGITLVKFGLVSKGYDTVVASDGEEGLKQVKEYKPDLIVLDVQMLNMNGYEFVGELKRIEGVETTPIIMLTANETMEDVFKLEGVKAYFVKPVNLVDLVAKIKECLGSNPV
ncbi:MAG: response regulator [Candidatus Zapsychrus exili]|nr:response regulator [Candidatus Zapsychrus exili]